MNKLVKAIAVSVFLCMGLESPLFSTDTQEGMLSSGEEEIVRRTSKIEEILLNRWGTSTADDDLENYQCDMVPIQGCQTLESYQLRSEVSKTATTMGINEETLLDKLGFSTTNYDLENYQDDSVLIELKDYGTEDERKKIEEDQRIFWESQYEPLSIQIYHSSPQCDAKPEIKQEFPKPQGLPQMPAGLILKENNEGILQIFQNFNGNFSTTMEIFQQGNKLHYVFLGSEHHETSAQANDDNNEKRRYPKELRKAGVFNYINPATGKLVKKFDFGHGIDLKDGTLQSTLCINNYTPQDPYYNRNIRRDLVEKIRKNELIYNEIAVYAPEPKLTKNGTPIPEGFLFIVRGNGVLTESYYFPNWFDYKSESKKETKPCEFFCKLFRLEKLPIALPLIYNSSLDGDHIRDRIRSNFKEASTFFECNKKLYPTLPEEARKALMRQIIFNLLSEAATFETDSTFYKAYFASLLTGYREVPELDLKNKQLAESLINVLKKQTFNDLDSLDTENRPWTPEGCKQVVDQMVDLHRLLRYTQEQEGCEEVERRMRKHAETMREVGFIILPVIYTAPEKLDS